MQNNKFLIIIAASTILLIGLGVLFATKTASNQIVETNPDAKVGVGETYYDWGDIGINDGNVEHEFEIKNEGKSDLVLSDVVTSCMCTSAQLIYDEKISPLFGMHTSSNYKLSVDPGKTAKLKVIFDPAFHGPNGIGAITREITVKTNDPNNPELSFTATAMVRK